MSNLPFTEAARRSPAVTFSVDLDDPFHGRFLPDKAERPGWRFGIHGKVGGLHDGPTSGDILCASLATCLDGTIRMIADRLDIRLQELSVEVTAEVDVRGTLMVDRRVPVGFQRMQCIAHLKCAQGPSPDLIEKLTKTVEQTCIVLQTLNRACPIDTVFEVS